MDHSLRTGEEPACASRAAGPTALALLQARHEARGTDAEGKAEPHVFPGLYHQREDLRALGDIHGDAYRWHDLRRTVTTRFAALGFHEDTIGRVLNHAKRGITATVYNQHAYDVEKKTALTAWDTELQRIIRNEPKPSKVLRHRPRGRK